MTGLQFHPVAWLAWLAAAGTVVVAIDNPFTTVAALVSVVVVASALAAPGPEGRSWTLFLKLGLLFLGIRLVLFGLTGHAGATTVVHVPEIALPAALGGFSVGGRVTAEVLAQSAAEGLRIAGFMLCFGVFLSVVQTYRVLRLLPRFLFEAGLVVTIAIAFVPTLLRSAADVRDAQRLRGHRFRGPWALRSVVVPVLANALERSLTLAASMESRGYGRTGGREAGAEARARAGILVGLFAVCGGMSVFLFGHELVGAALMLPGGVLIGAGLRALARAVPRTRYRTERLGVWDGAFVAISAVTIVLTLAARALPEAAWYAHPVAVWPSLDIRLLAPAVALAAPLALVVARRARLRRASAAHPVPSSSPPAEVVRA